MRELNFTKEHTKIAKGVAILLMLTHHLFAFPDRIHLDQGYISLFSIGGNNIEFIMGVFGNICVSMYIFLSGYGIYMSSLKNGKITLKDSFKRLKKLYINYWIVFIIFVPIGFIFFNKELNIREFILNFVGWSSSYNGEWWFFKLYVELILLVSILKHIVNDGLFKSIVNITVVLLFSKVIEYGINMGIDKFIPSLILYEVHDILFWQACFFIGYICAKFDIYSKVLNLFIKIKMDNKIIYAILLLSIIFVRSKFGYIFAIDFLLTPILMFSAVNLLYDSVFHKLFILLGKHSTNMWLIHSFFCYTYFQWLVFKPRVSILILIWLVVLSLGSSYFINYLHKWGSILFMKCKKVVKYNDLV